jgi:hypothetical protein
MNSETAPATFSTAESTACISTMMLIPWILRDAERPQTIVHTYDAAKSHAALAVRLTTLVHDDPDETAHTG